MRAGLYKFSKLMKICGVPHTPELRNPFGGMTGFAGSDHRNSGVCHIASKSDSMSKIIHTCSASLLTSDFGFRRYWALGVIHDEEKLIFVTESSDSQHNFLLC